MKTRHQLRRQGTGITAFCLFFLSACGGESGVQNDSGTIGSDGGFATDGAPNSGDPTLSNIEVSGTSPITPAFTPSQLAYQIDVSVLESEIRITPTSADPSATILVDNMQVDSGDASPPIALELGVNQISLIVTTSDAQSSTYQLEVSRGASVIEQIAYGKASNTEVNGSFATSVAISGDTLAVGAIGEDSNATGIGGNQANDSASQSGAVFVFRRSGTNWAQEAYAKASNTGAGDSFGSSVALSGDTLAVGARLEDSNATGIDGNQADNSEASSGAVYVFKRTGTNWAQEAYIKASNPEFIDFFGEALALSGDTLAVAAPGEDSNATGVNGDQSDNSASASGAVYVFSRTGSSWSQTAYLKASNAGSLDSFGDSVALDGDTLAVGAFREESNASGINGDQEDNTSFASGAVYVFRSIGTSWSQEAYLKASAPDFGDFFGTSVAISGDLLAVGAIQEASNAVGVDGDQGDNNAEESGAAYIFRRTGTTWSQEAYLKASNTEEFDNFGISVAVSENTVAVAAYTEDSNATGLDGDQSDNSASEAGAVYIFSRPENTWSQVAYVKASNSGANDDFGGTLAISKDTLVVGASLEDSDATGVNGNQGNDDAGQSGAIYLFQ